MSAPRGNCDCKNRRYKSNCGEDDNINFVDEEHDCWRIVASIKGIEGQGTRSH
jgi:hypothetical protein